MRLINARRLLESSSCPELHVRGIEFVQRHHTEVYRVRTTDATYILHVTAQSTELMRRVHGNLRRLEVLQDNRIPRVVRWWDGGETAAGGQQWAALLMTEIPGTELSSSTVGDRVWNDICEVLRAVHGLPAEEWPPGAQLRIDDASAFPDFAESLLSRVAPLAVGRDRLRRHLSAMSEYISKHSESFRISSRLIHGDVSRGNIMVNGGAAGLIDWEDLAPGDYAYDLAMLKFAMDSVAPRVSGRLLREQAREYRARFADDSLETRMRFFLALPGLLKAFCYAGEESTFQIARAWRVKMCYLHSESQWASWLRLDGPEVGAAAAPTDHWHPLRGLPYLLADVGR